MRDNKPLILVVDDETRIVRVLQDYLVATGYHVLCAYDGEEALDMFYAHSTEIDMVLLDLMMPKKNGLEVLRELRTTSLVPVLLLTAKGEEYDQVRGFQCGADDYVVKPFSMSVLVLRMEAVLLRAGKSSNSELTNGPFMVNHTTREALCHGVQLQLTRREFDLLAYFLLHPGQVFTREQLLNGVWGYDFEGELRTVDTHVKQLRGKLGDMAYMLKTVFRAGYKLEVDHEATT